MSLRDVAESRLHPLREAEREAVEQFARVLFPNVPTLLEAVKPVSKLIQ